MNPSSFTLKENLQKSGNQLVQPHKYPSLIPEHQPIGLNFEKQTKVYTEERHGKVTGLPKANTRHEEWCVTPNYNEELNDGK